MFPDDVDEVEEGGVVAAEEEKEVERGKEEDVGLCSDAADATTDVTKYCHAPVLPSKHEPRTGSVGDDDDDVIDCLLDSLTLTKSFRILVYYSISVNATRMVSESG